MLQKLPENELYWPPMMFQCEDMRQFGRKVLVGNHLLSSVTEFIVKCEMETTGIYFGKVEAIIHVQRVISMWMLGMSFLMQPVHKRLVTEGKRSVRCKHSRRHTTFFSTQCRKNFLCQFLESDRHTTGRDFQSNQHNVWKGTTLKHIFVCIEVQ